MLNLSSQKFIETHSNTKGKSHLRCFCSKSPINCINTDVTHLSVQLLTFIYSQDVQKKSPSVFYFQQQNFDMRGKKSLLLLLLFTFVFDCSLKSFFSHLSFVNCSLRRLLSNSFNLIAIKVTQCNNHNKQTQFFRRKNDSEYNMTDSDTHVPMKLVLLQPSAFWDRSLPHDNPEKKSVGLENK